MKVPAPATLSSMSRELEIEVDFGGRIVKETWDETPEWRCPSCANQTVWCSRDGDYYLGSTFLCSACGASFHEPSEAGPGTSRYLSALRAKLKP